MPASLSRTSTVVSAGTGVSVTMPPIRNVVWRYAARASRPGATRLAISINETVTVRGRMP